MPLPEFNLEGKVYIVTGGGRGLGVALAGAIVEAGAKKVYCLDLLPEPHEGWVQVKQALALRGQNLVFKGGLNVTDEAGIEKTFDEIVQTEGRLDGLVCAAGIIYIKDAIQQSAEEFRKVLDTNVLGHFICSRTFARHAQTLDSPGAIVLIASMSAHICNQGLSSIGMNSSKAAICQMARSMACEWAPLKVRVNTLSPGYIASPIPRERYERDPEGLKVIEAQNPMGRISTPEEYRGAAVFMLSDASCFMTGSDLIIDGGHRAW